MKKLVCALLLGAAVSMPASAANLLTNGGFDDDASVVAGGFTIYSAGDVIGGGGWTVTGSGGNSALNLSTTYVEPGVAFPAQAGANALDITAAGNTSPTNGVFQDVATVIGRTYLLSFFVGNATGDGTGNSGFYLLPSSVGVSIDGGAATTYVNATTTPGSVNWLGFSQQFVATNALTRVAFTNATPSSDNYAGLDSVSLTAVPEPATWAMMIGGVGLVGGSLRRRRVTKALVAHA